MEPLIKLSLNNSEMQTLIYGLQEFRRALLQSSIRQESDEVQAQHARVLAILTKMDIATQQAIIETSAKVDPNISGGQKLANLTHEFVADVSLLSSEYSFCLACALGAAAQMLTLNAATTPHDPLNTNDLETEVSEQQFVHRAGRA